MLITLLLHIVSSSFFLQSPSCSLILVLSSLPFPALTALPSFSAQLDEILTYKAAVPMCAFCLWPRFESCSVLPTVTFTYVPSLLVLFFPIPTLFSLELTRVLRHATLCFSHSREGGYWRPYWNEPPSTELSATRGHLRDWGHSYRSPGADWQGQSGMALLRMRFSLHCLPCVLIKLVDMVIECCSQEHSYSNFYGLVSERFCKLNQECNECHESFETYFETIRHMKRIFCVISHGYHMALWPPCKWCHLLLGHSAGDQDERGW